MILHVRKIEHRKLTLTPMEEAAVRKVAADMCKKEHDTIDNIANYYELAAYSVLSMKDLLDSALAEPLLVTDVQWDFKEEN